MIFIRLVTIFCLYATYQATEFEKCNEGRKACLGIPEGCLPDKQNECDYIIGFDPPSNNEEYVTIELSTHRFTPHIDYIAIGFSDDQEMVCLIKRLKAEMQWRRKVRRHIFEPRVIGAHSFNNASLEFPQMTGIKLNMLE
uniref:Uncharacterized protein n=1 Tax=Acrobeloides nanus TaxID=290746 RepID=A0A914DGG0_9BILA